MDGKQKVVVIAVLTNSKGQVLISRRNDEYVPDAHNKWALVGGKLEYGEDPEDCLKREVMEETGLEIKLISLLPKIFTQFWTNKHSEQFQVILLPYRCEITDESKIDFSKDPKIAELKFIKISEVSNFDFIPLDKEIINLLNQ